MLGRTYLMCSLLSLALCAACEEPDAGSVDSGVGAIGAASGGTMGGVSTDSRPAGNPGASGSGIGTAPGSGTAGTPGGSTGAALGGNAAGTPGNNTAGALGGNTAGGNTASTPSGDAGAAPGDSTAGAAGGNTAGAAGGSSGSCPGIPPVTDYAAKGSFPVKVIPNAGPDGTYYLFRPDDASIGRNGAKHPIVVWGNGILTSPDQYTKLLSFVASHGFVIVACPSPMPERPCLNSGMDWLVKQNTDDAIMKGKLDVTKELTMGYSWGGGASIDTADRPNVKATVSIHGMPPRGANAWTAMKSPLLLFTSPADTVVTVEQHVTPNYEKSKVPTFYATLLEDVGHLYPLDETAISCLVEVALGGPCAAAIKEQAPLVAWLRLWACDDQNAKKYFYGADCLLCKTPWKSQNKPAGAWQ